MKASLLTLLLPAAASARFIETNEINRVITHPEGHAGESTEKFLVELAPGVTKLVTEEQKWELRRVCVTARAGRDEGHRALARPSLRAC